MTLVKIPGVPGTAKLHGYDDGNWFVADSFSSGVERELSRTVTIAPRPNRNGLVPISLIVSDGTISNDSVDGNAADPVAVGTLGAVDPDGETSFTFGLIDSAAANSISLAIRSPPARTSPSTMRTRASTARS